MAEADKEAIYNDFILKTNLILYTTGEHSAAKFNTLKYDVQKPVNYYMEKQEGLQCGRHAANAFFGQSHMKDTELFHNIEVDDLYHQMQGFVDARYGQNSNEAKKRLKRLVLHVTAYDISDSRLLFITST